MARHDELVRAAVARHGGYVFATGGDSFGVAFHRAERRRGLGHRAAGRDRAASPGPTASSCGCGSGCTPARPRSAASGYFGPAVNVAARLAAAAHGGQTLVSGVTAVLLDRGDLRDLGTYRLDGVIAEQRILQLGDGEHPPLRDRGPPAGQPPPALGSPHRPRRATLDAIAEALAGVADRDARRARAGSARPGSPWPRPAGSRWTGPAGAWLVELAEIAALERRAPGGRRRPRRAGVPGAHADPVDRGRPAAATGRCWSSTTASTSSTAPPSWPRRSPRAAPTSGVLATSREGLGIGGEQLVAVAPLEPAGAGGRAVRRAGAAAVSPTLRSARPPGRGRGDLPAPRRRPARHRAGGGPHHEPVAGRPGGPARRPAPAADRGPAQQRRAPPDLRAAHQVVLRPAHARPSSGSSSSCRSSPGRSTSTPPRPSPPLPWTARPDGDVDVVDGRRPAGEPGRAVDAGRRVRAVRAPLPAARDHAPVRRRAPRPRPAHTDLLGERHARWCLDRGHPHRRAPRRAGRDRGRRPARRAVAQPAGGGRLGLRHRRPPAGPAR